MQVALPPPLQLLASAFAHGEVPPQTLKEYDPEWARAFWTGTVSQGCPHDTMLAAVKVPVLFTHHFRIVDEESGFLLGASSDLQAARVCQLVESAGNPCEYRSLPAMGHSFHGQDPAQFVDTLVSWASSLAR
jgi:acetyl esterase/lipase